MDFEKYTERARGFIQSAQTLALREGHQQFTPEHLLKVLLDDEEGLAAVADRARRRRSEARALAASRRRSKRCRKVEGGNGQLYLAQPTGPGLRRPPSKLAKKAGDSFVTVERLLQALAIEKSAKTAEILKAGVTPQALNEAINDAPQGPHRRSAHRPSRAMTR